MFNRKKDATIHKVELPKPKKRNISELMYFMSNTFEGLNVKLVDYTRYFLDDIIFTVKFSFDETHKINLNYIDSTLTNEYERELQKTIRSILQLLNEYSQHNPIIPWSQHITSHARIMCTKAYSTATLSQDVDSLYPKSTITPKEYGYLKDDAILSSQLFKYIDTIKILDAFNIDKSHAVITENGTIVITQSTNNKVKATIISEMSIDSNEIAYNLLGNEIIQIQNFLATRKDGEQLELAINDNTRILLNADELLSLIRIMRLFIKDEIH